MHAQGAESAVHYCVYETVHCFKFVALLEFHIFPKAELQCVQYTHVWFQVSTSVNSAKSAV